VIGFSRTDLDRVAELLHAGMDCVSGRVDAIFDFAGYCFGAANHKLLESQQALVK
jgi:hypothetical protein